MESPLQSRPFTPSPAYRFQDSVIPTRQDYEDVIRLERLWERCEELRQRYQREKEIFFRGRRSRRRHLVTREDREADYELGTALLTMDAKERDWIGFQALRDADLRFDLRQRERKMREDMSDMERFIEAARFLTRHSG